MWLKLAKNWKKEVVRDIIALGSIIFYFLLVIRAIIGKYMPFVYELLIALVVLFILSKIIKNSNQYIARGLILVVFTSMFYKAMLYTFFVFLLLFGMIFSLYYVKTKTSEIVKGILLGIISALISYSITSLII